MSNNTISFPLNAPLINTNKKGKITSLKKGHSTATHVYTYKTDHSDTKPKTLVQKTNSLFSYNLLNAKKLIYNRSISNRGNLIVNVSQELLRTKQESLDALKKFAAQLSVANLAYVIINRATNTTDPLYQETLAPDSPPLEYAPPPPYYFFPLAIASYSLASFLIRMFPAHHKHNSLNASTAHTIALVSLLHTTQYLANTTQALIGDNNLFYLSTFLTLFGLYMLTLDLAKTEPFFNKKPSGIFFITLFAVSLFHSVNLSIQSIQHILPTLYTSTSELIPEDLAHYTSPVAATTSLCILLIAIRDAIKLKTNHAYSPIPS